MNQSPLQLSGNSIQTLKEISDTLVFDYLIDDHDRKYHFNWMASRDGSLLLWDSGLALRHGPYPRDNCLDILCGHTEWREQNSHNNDSHCEKICVFSQEMVSFLRSRFNSPNPNQRQQQQHWNGSSFDSQIPTLSMLWKQEIEKEVIEIFRYAFFWRGKGYLDGKIRIDPMHFYDGLSTRINLLLTHVDRCIQAFNQSSVLI